MLAIAFLAPLLLGLGKLGGAALKIGGAAKAAGGAIGGAGKGAGLLAAGKGSVPGGGGGTGLTGLAQLGHQLGMKLGMTQPGPPMLPGDLPVPGPLQMPQFGASVAQGPQMGFMGPGGAQMPQVNPLIPSMAPAPPTAGVDDELKKKAIEQIGKIVEGQFSKGSGQGQGGSPGPSLPALGGGPTSVPPSAGPVPPTGAEGFGGAGTQLAQLLPQGDIVGESDFLKRILALQAADRLIGGGGGAY